ncbi:MAG: hypothetical protein AUJ57_05550 [Zetaproteobacteria bacterium CG1_02_53_45]|nr:MAG: hypothetical protein AUJ57_05550 [Zetaproteobacteria bacterium CG1_02_53_45]
MVKICVIKTSVRSIEQADMLADGLVAAGIAACVQIFGPGMSVYRWQGRVEQEQEFYLTIKTSTELCKVVVDWLTESHPYDTPEIIWAEYQASDVYADWLAGAVKLDF